MKVKIDESGYLHIERHGEMNEQVCPYYPGSRKGCGDWCPHFYRSLSVVEMNNYGLYEMQPTNSRKYRFLSLGLCNGTVLRMEE